MIRFNLVKINRSKQTCIINKYIINNIFFLLGQQIAKNQFSIEILKNIINLLKNL